MIDKSVTIWCENIFSLYSAGTLAEKYANKGYRVYFYTFRSHFEASQRHLGSTIYEYRLIESIDSLILHIIHHICFVFFVSPFFSKMYTRVRQSSAFLFFVSKYFGIPISKRKQNKYYFLIFSLFNRIKFPTKTVFSFTLNKKPYLLCNKSIRHISIMESWDHPVKQPYLIYPNMCLTWAKSLREDIIQHQHLARVRLIRPLKFRYIYDFEKQSEPDLLRRLTNPVYINELARLQGKKFILYPATTSSLNPFAHSGEMKLLEKLCSCTAANSHTLLYIKPKPNGAQGDYDIFKRHAHVVIGLYPTDSSALDLLDNEYNIYRYLLLKNAFLVVNVGTTFVLEAALMNIPIMQLILQDGSFDKFSVYSKNMHIVKYLHDRSCEVINDGSQITIEDTALAKYTSYSQKLKQWITDIG